MPYPDNFSSGRLDEAQGRDDAEAELIRDQEDLALEHSAWRQIERLRRSLSQHVAHNEELNKIITAADETLYVLRNQFSRPNNLWRAKKEHIVIHAATRPLAILQVLGKYYNSSNATWSKASADGWTLEELPL